MAYQQSQPLGSGTRGGGGGWRALSFLNSLEKKPPTDAQQSALKGGAGPVSEKGAKDYLAQQSNLNSILGQGSQTVGGALSQMQKMNMGYQNTYAGYTAGTGDTGKASGNSY